LEVQDSWAILLSRSFWHAVTPDDDLRGKQRGLSLLPFVELQTRNALMDTNYSREQLGYEKGDLDKALEDTVSACLPNSL
jgi:hypothetical protein